MLDQSRLHWQELSFFLLADQTTPKHAADVLACELAPGAWLNSPALDAQNVNTSVLQRLSHRWTKCQCAVHAAHRRGCKEPVED